MDRLNSIIATYPLLPSAIKIRASYPLTRRTGLGLPDVVLPIPFPHRNRRGPPSEESLVSSPRRSWTHRLVELEFDSASNSVPSLRLRWSHGVIGSSDRVGPREEDIKS
ncbi:hypothetical protein CRG98_028911 [Punica granatum]|uniref:Uncharacterized protein n=1 Tax=Punica granatum TaxID=22663 RepID=A0A2I0J3G1_PUNGR|nr:hypothetical protein CRG98_028911 [Punica granatum]